MDTIEASVRAGKTKAKQLRRSGIVPCVIYGAGLEASLPIQIPLAAARTLSLTKRVGSQVDVRVGERHYQTLIKELERNRVTDEILHIGFQSLEKGKKANGVADVVLLNRDKVQGVLEQLQMQIPHAAEPEYLLDTVTVDLDGCGVGTIIKVGDIPALRSGRIELRTDPGNIVVRISEKRRSAPEEPPSGTTEPVEE